MSLSFPTAPRPLHIAVVGAGWAGLSAAVEATRQGHAVTLFEMAPQAGGRARSLAPQPDGSRLDNGQHILIGAYTATLDLMRQVGVDTQAVFWRHPLILVDAKGRGLRMPPGPAVPAFLRAVWSVDGWTWRDRWALQTAATGWLLKGFRCPATQTVAQLTAMLPPRVRKTLIDPLCVAALNTPSADASATVFLRVLKDALFSGPGASDLLVPRRPLAELLPEPALTALRHRGADIRLSERVEQVTDGPCPTVNGLPFDHVILACSAKEAARLTRTTAPAWSAIAEAFTYEPIITAYLDAPGARLAAPMVALPEGPEDPAQFAFDHGQLDGTPGRLALVVSGAGPWMSRGPDDTADHLQRQAARLIGKHSPNAQTVQLVKMVTEKRATFRCVPGLTRPAARVTAHISAAGDHIDGPYPATIEEAVRSGREAVSLVVARRV